MDSAIKVDGHLAKLSGDHCEVLRCEKFQVFRCEIVLNLAGVHRILVLWFLCSPSSGLPFLPLSHLAAGDLDVVETSSTAFAARSQVTLNGVPQERMKKLGQMT